MSLLPEMDDLIARHASADLEPSIVPGLQLYKSDAATASMPVVYRPMLCVMISGAKQVLLGEAAFTYRGGDCLVVSAELPVSGRIIEAPYRSMSVDLDPAEIARLTLDGDGADDAPPPRGVIVARMEQALIDPLARLLRLLDRPQEIAPLAPLIHREILWRLLHGPHGGVLRQMATAESRLAGVNRAIRWLRANFAEPMRLDDLAAMAGMSLSTFHRHFRTVTTMSPLQYQKQVRLQEARARLLSGAGGAADTGFAVGYDSPSQFSREYARLFGAPPVRDVARLKAAGVPVAV